jgi:hypothetical protein
MSDTITEEVVAPIKIGETEYTTSELESLIADGQFKRDIESKQNTKIDKVFGEYTKLTQDKSNWEAERSEYLRLKEEKENANKPQQDFDEATIQAAQNEARKLGLYTKTEVEQYFNETFPKQYAQQRAADKLLEGMEGLEKEITGSDGRPKFVLDEILQHMRDTGIKDPNRAYKDKYETELDSWKEKKLSGAKREGIFSEQGSTAGGKQPTEVRPTRANVGQLVREALNGS